MARPKRQKHTSAYTEPRSQSHITFAMEVDTPLQLSTLAGDAAATNPLQHTSAHPQGYGVNTSIDPLPRSRFVSRKRSFYERESEGSASPEIKSEPDIKLESSDEDIVLGQEGEMSEPSCTSEPESEHGGDSSDYDNSELSSGTNGYEHEDGGPDFYIKESEFEKGEVPNKVKTHYAEKDCAWCDNPATKKCSDCLGTVSSTKECQKQEWPIHKQVCKTFKAISDTPRPSRHHRLVIVLVTEDGPPVVKWMDLDDFHQTELDAVVGGHARPSYIHTNDRTKKLMTKATIIYCNDSALLDHEIKRNKSVDAATLGKSQHNVRGGLALSRDGGAENRRLADITPDITPGTFTHFVDTVIYGNARGMPVGRPAGTHKPLPPVMNMCLSPIHVLDMEAVRNAFETMGGS